MRRLTVKPEPVHCVCEPGALAHEQHARPGAGAGKHLDARCPHSTLWADTVGYERARLQRAADLAEKEARRAFAVARQRRPIPRLTG